MAPGMPAQLSPRPNPLRAYTNPSPRPQPAAPKKRRGLRLPKSTKLPRLGRTPLIIGAAVLVAGGAAVWLAAGHKKPARPVATVTTPQADTGQVQDSAVEKVATPSEVEDSLDFPVYFFSDELMKSDDKNYVIDTKKQQFSFRATLNPDNTVTVTVSEQAMPDDLKGDSKQLQDTVKALGLYATLSAKPGAAYLTAQSKSADTVVLVTTPKTLIFLRAKDKLDTKKWEQIINTLEVNRF